MGDLRQDLPMTYLEKGSSHDSAAAATAIFISISAHAQHFSLLLTFPKFFSFSIFSRCKLLPLRLRDLHNLSVIPCDSIFSLGSFSCQELVAGMF